ncbi:MAG: c-type cytochrome [Gammaproteobacteria bacterium]|nr:c-type cytochrome [Gammaproteobacteria bacterium]
MPAILRPVVLILLALLSACADDQRAPVPSLGPSTPADPEVAEIYNRSCRSCHAQGAAQAPLTGDRAAWAPRLEQGMEVLLEHTISGYNGMPPLGMCFDCEEEDFAALITFMSGSGG